jgi:hypothetical protein
VIFETLFASFRERYLLGTWVNKGVEKGRGCYTPALSSLGVTLRTSHTVAVGLMFWLMRKRLAGSYLFFMATNLS